MTQHILRCASGDAAATAALAFMFMTEHERQEESDESDEAEDELPDRNASSQDEARKTKILKQLLKETMKQLFYLGSGEGGFCDPDAPMQDEDEFMQSEKVHDMMARVQSTLDEVGSEVTAEQYILAMKRTAKTAVLAEQTYNDNY